MLNQLLKKLVLIVAGALLALSIFASPRPTTGRRVLLTPFISTPLTIISLPVKQYLPLISNPQTPTPTATARPTPIDPTWTPTPRNTPEMMANPH